MPMARAFAAFCLLFRHPSRATIFLQQPSGIETRKRQRRTDRRLAALTEKIGKARENAAGLHTADVFDDCLGRDVEQGVAGHVAALLRQALDGFGDQPHGALKLGQALEGRVGHVS
jgi:hypothetical protein